MLVQAVDIVGIANLAGGLVEVAVEVLVGVEEVIEVEVGSQHVACILYLSVVDVECRNCQHLLSLCTENLQCGDDICLFHIF